MFCNVQYSNTSMNISQSQTINYCAYSAAMALVQTKEFLTKNVSTNINEWKWKNVHHNDYMALPWSRTPLKFMFHRSNPSAGNNNTPNVSKTPMKKYLDSQPIHGIASANYKMLIQFAKDPKDDISLFSMDTGMNGNPF